MKSKRHYKIKIKKALERRGDEADYFEREYARLALVLPELASEQG